VPQYIGRSRSDSPKRAIFTNKPPLHHMNNRELKSLGKFQKMRRSALSVLLLVVVIGLLFCGPAFTDANYENDVIEITGIGLIGVAIIGRLWCTLYLGGRKAAEIVTKGPCSITRNPLYVFSAIGAIGVGAQTGSLTVSLFFGAATVLAFYIVIFREEAFLREAFGTPYENYCAAVPRFFPKFSLYQDSEIVSFYPERLRSTLRDGFVFFLAAPAFELIQRGQEWGYLPVLIRLI
jgi:protein-S-isoprenylcysteine O-methyltransferase Ste14